MNVVVFGHSMHPYTLAILEAFQRRTIPVSALVERTKIDYDASAVSAILKSEGISMRVLLNRNFLNARSFALVAKNPGFGLLFFKEFFLKKGVPKLDLGYDLKAKLTYKNVALRTYSVSDYNSKRTEKTLKELAPDVIILGPTGQIIRHNILAIPRIGTLNSHMGLLPQYKGLSALEWSILNHDKLGITTHFVDVGVDTGDIVARRPLEVSGEMTLGDVISNAFEVMADSLAETVEAIASNDYEREPQDPTEGKQYFLMHEKLLAVVRERLREYSKSL